MTGAADQGWIANVDVGAFAGAHLDLDRLPLGFGLLDRELKFRRMNRSYADYLSANTPYTPEQAMGRGYFDCIAASGRKAQAIMQNVLGTGHPYALQREELPIRIDGREVLTYWDGQIAPVVETSGTVSGLVVICTEVSDGAGLSTPAEPELSDLIAGILTYKEEQVVRMIAEGLTSKEIAARLHVTKAAIDARRNAIRRKLGLTARDDNLYRALRGHR